MKNWLMTILSMSLFLTGGLRPQGATPCSVVTEVRIQARAEEDTVERVYITQHKMNKVLNYLRHLDPWDPAELDVDTQAGTKYGITLTLSDGTVRTYDQTEYRYLRSEDGIWREITPELGIRLPLLIAAIPSDPEPISGITD